MRVSDLLPLACMCVVLLWGHRGGATPLPFNMSAEGSGEGEPEILDPAAYTTHSPVLISTTARVTTVTRIKHFIFHQVVDFLRENLLLIIVVSSLVIVLIFIVCCASVMSHKRKLTAYYPSSFPTKKYVDQKDKSGGARTFSDVHGKPPNSQQPEAGDPSRPFQTADQVVTKNLRTPSKALVGDKGKETSPRPCDVENKQEETIKEERRPVENMVANGNKGAQAQGLVCLCHLRKGNPPSSSQNSPGMEGRVAQSDANPTTSKVQGIIVD
ncbi:transmembrane protein 119-like [Scleropages formosus]|uniref:transmembrane protein 119-like n=1 Tax=Scleropages formosus TaxID=113540 RepID=UPI000878C6CD|nr:transmembrane protein 119-like [Scleropages formosus]